VQQHERRVTAPTATTAPIPPPSTESAKADATETTAPPETTESAQAGAVEPTESAQAAPTEPTDSSEADTAAAVEPAVPVGAAIRPECDQWGFLRSYAAPVPFEAFANVPTKRAGAAFDCLGRTSLVNIIEVRGGPDPELSDVLSVTESNGGGDSLVGVGELTVNGATYGVLYNANVLQAISVEGGGWEPVSADFFGLVCTDPSVWSSLGEAAACVVDEYPDRVEPPPGAGVVFEAALTLTGAAITPWYFAPLATSAGLEDLNGFSTERFDVGPEAIELFAENLGVPVDATDASASYWVHTSGFIAKTELQLPATLAALLVGEPVPDLYLRFEWAQ